MKLTKQQRAAKIEVLRANMANPAIVAKQQAARQATLLLRRKWGVKTAKEAKKLERRFISENRVMQQRADKERIRGNGQGVEVDDRGNIHRFSVAGSKTSSFERAIIGGDKGPIAELHFPDVAEPTLLRLFKLLAELVELLRK